MGRPTVPEEDKAKPNDRLNCEVCGMDYSRSNKSKHIVSKLHKMAERLTAGEKQHGGFNGIKEYKHKKLSNKEVKKRLKNLDSESESEEESSEEETPRKKSTHQYKKRLIGDNNIIDSVFADIPEEYHDYIKQNHGKIYLKPDGIEYFNNPNYSYEQKIAMIDEISKLPRKKYHDDIDNNVVHRNNIFHGNPEEIKEKIRNLGKFYYSYFE
jgi:hypothetical protein